MDDDNYVNVRMLVKLLSSYLHTQDIYIGKPSLDRPIQATERISENKMVSVGRAWGCFNLGCVEKELLSHALVPLSRSILCISGLPRVEQGSVSAGGWH